jgi:hypothetical protein
MKVMGRMRFMEMIHGIILPLWGGKTQKIGDRAILAGFGKACYNPSCEVHPRRIAPDHGQAVEYKKNSH